MDAIVLQILNGLDKGSAYALIALGLTLIFGTLGVVNFAHGALFMIGAFCAVTFSKLLTLSHVVIDETQKDFLGNPLKVNVPYIHDIFGQQTGDAITLEMVAATPRLVIEGRDARRIQVRRAGSRRSPDEVGELTFVAPERPDPQDADQQGDDDRHPEVHRIRGASVEQDGPEGVEDARQRVEEVGG